MQYFGTDGIRGRWPDDLLNEATVRRLGQALLERFGGPIAIIRDTRESGVGITAALGDSLRGEGIDYGVLPTPALSALLADGVAAAGVAITASHNPWHDNGLKVLGPGGEKLEPEVEAALDAALSRGGAPPYSSAGLPTRRADDGEARYLAALLAAVPEGLRLDGVIVALDCANGAAHRTAPAALEALGATVIPVAASPSGRNINADVGAASEVGLRALSALVIERGAAVGVALDGDGDRCALVDAEGRVLDGDALLWLLARPPGLVGTIMCNSALEDRLLEQGVGFARAQVGDRNVAIEMARRGWTVGGETSGHVLLTDGLPTGDGLLTAIRVLAGGVDLSARLRGWSLYPCAERSVAVRAKPPLSGLPAVAAAIARVQRDGARRVVLRYSGTEPKLRVLVEAAGQAAADAWLEALLAETLAAIDAAAQGAG